MEDCLFCRIVSGGIPAKKAYEDETALAFYDIDPKAPVHVLVIPKKHIASLAAAGEEDFGLVTHLMRVAQRLAKELKLDNGFRLVVNTGREGGQTVAHLHIHLLGGRAMGWPPG
jgi:Diadenosine tetraphosphate (Ap4A) hydrolase and other HIT family hydrolases